MSSVKPFGHILGFHCISITERKPLPLWNSGTVAGTTKCHPRLRHGEREAGWNSSFCGWTIPLMPFHRQILWSMRMAFNTWEQMSDLLSENQQEVTSPRCMRPDRRPEVWGRRFLLAARRALGKGGGWWWDRRGGWRGSGVVGCLSGRTHLLPLGALPFRRARPQEPPACQTDLCSQMQPRREGRRKKRGERKGGADVSREEGKKGRRTWRKGGDGEVGGRGGRSLTHTQCSRRQDTPCMRNTPPPQTALGVGEGEGDSEVSLNSGAVLSMAWRYHRPSP